MYARITNDVSMVQLQRAIDALTDWAREWQLGVSVEKCCVLNIGTNISLTELHLESSKLSEVRDLGIVVSDCLSPSAHVADVVAEVIGVLLLYYVHLRRRMSDCCCALLLFM